MWEKAGKNWLDFKDVNSGGNWVKTRKVQH